MSCGVVKEVKNWAISTLEHIFLWSLKINFTVCFFSVQEIITFTLSFLAFVLLILQLEISKISDHTMWGVNFNCCFLLTKISTAVNFSFANDTANKPMSCRNKTPIFFSVFISIQRFTQTWTKAMVSEFLIQVLSC